MSRLKKIARIFLSKNFLIYSLIGTINTINTAVFSGLLALIIEENVASYLGFILSLSCGYLLNARFNFHHKISFVEYIRFMSSYVPNFLIYIAISTVAISVWGWPPFWATVLAAVAGVPVTFALMKFYAFGNAKYQKDANDKDL